MKFVKNIFTVSFFAIMVVVGARAEIVSKTNIVAGDNVTISTPAAGEPNGGKIVIKATLPDATPDTKGGVRIMTSAGGIDETSATEDAKVPTVAAAWDIANIAAGNNSVEKQQGASNADGILITNTDGEVTPVRVKSEGTGNAVTDVKVENGKYIVTKETTFATKAELNALDNTTTGSGAVVTNVTQTDGKVAVTKGNVQVPVGSATATTYASIWIE